MTFLIRQARSNEVDTVLDLLYERVRWLAERGSDQWSTTTSSWPSKVTAAVTAGHTWLLIGLDEVPLGTVTLSTVGDPDFWTSEELSESALYVAKLATSASCAGTGLGSLMLRWTVDHAHRHGHKPVRLDVWKTARDLHAWYRSQGWQHLRTVERPERKSGALFSHEPQRMLLPNLVSVDAATSQISSFSDDR